MRVGLRRLRAAMSIFKALLQDVETEKLKTQLKWLTEQVGPALTKMSSKKQTVASLRKAGAAIGPPQP